MLTDAQLDSMSVTQELALPDLCDISRPTRATNTIGGTGSTGETSIATNVPCRVFPGQMMTAIGQQSRPIEVNKFIVRVPRTTLVQDRDVIDHLPTSERLRVERVRDVQSYDTVLTLECEVIS